MVKFLCRAIAMLYFWIVSIIFPENENQRQMPKTARKSEKREQKFYNGCCPSASADVTFMSSPPLLINIPFVFNPAPGKLPIYYSSEDAQFLVWIKTVKEVFCFSRSLSIRYTSPTTKVLTKRVPQKAHPSGLLWCLQKEILWKSSRYGYFTLLVLRC